MAVSLLPAQAFASNSNSMQQDRVATAEEYRIMQIVVEELNAEYGASVWLLPYSDYAAQGLALPLAVTPENLEAFSAAARENVIWAETTNLELQLATVNNYLNASYDTRGAVLPPNYASLCTNSTPWGVQTMINIISQEGYSDEVIRFVALRNPAFAVVVNQAANSEIGAEPSLIVSLSNSNDTEGIQPQDGGGKSMKTSTMSYLGLGKSKATGNVEGSGSNSIWKNATSATWATGIGYPSFAAYSSYILGTGLGETCSAYHKGELSTYDYVWNVLFQQFTEFAVTHYASNAV